MITYIIFFFVLGIVFGSFANVCIYRIPKDESIISPPSHCTSCGQSIKWFDNIPILSFIILKGNCRHCNSKISLRYPLIELLNGFLFAIIAWKFAFSSEIFVYLLFTFLLLLIAAIDYDHQIIPDIFSLILLLTALSYTIFNYSLGYDIKTRIVNSFLGILSGSGSLFIIGYLGTKIFKKEAMGAGDIKLMAGIGALLGWHKTLTTLFFASLLGSLAGIYLILSGRINKKDYIPFGPFITVACYINILLPDIW